MSTLSLGDLAPLGRVEPTASPAHHAPWARSPLPVNGAGGGLLRTPEVVV